jgi:2-methylcitrate dehydratase PrpD
MADASENLLGRASVTTRSDNLGETEALLRVVSALDVTVVPGTTRERVKDLLLDHLGVTLFGATMPWSGIVREVVGNEGGRAESTIYGGGLVSARNAALINGTAAHGAELDDTHDESLSHPGAAVIPAAVALAEAKGSSGADFLTAVIIGYEVMGRLGSAIADAMQQRGFHPTAQLGVFGAAAAAGFLLGLDIKKSTAAFGIAASMSSGSQKFTQDPEGTMIKRMHGGLPSERGILAAKLAASGFTGPRAALEGPFGVATILSGLTDLTRMTAGPSEGLEIDNVSIKLYPCCRLFHSLIEAISACRAMDGFDSDQIATIGAHVPESYIKGHLERRPTSMMAAQYSLPFVAATATCGDAASPSSFSEDSMRRPNLLALIDKVEPTVSQQLGAIFPKHLPARVVFKMTDGRKFERTVFDSRGSPEQPIGRSDVQAKFRSLTSTILTSQRQEEIMNQVFCLDMANDVRGLTTLLRSTTL